MHIDEIRTVLHPALFVIQSKEITELRPAQSKAINAGLLKGKNILVCTPTASGKTLIAELAMLEAVLSGKGKAIYIAPLKALASEKYKAFSKKYSTVAKVALSIGELDSADSYLECYDLIMCTAEKLDSLLRHHCPWLSSVRVVVVDEIHLLNDPERGPTLEILMTLLRMLLPKMQLIGLSATIGNPEELASWMQATLVTDSWRPVTLEKGIYFEGELEFV
ncbi:DEAD/DEAH box helicase [Candidatus Woesearchaeota archaeon]|nr:DEAD/DEAH box helicase [Candidatus Woesearchaeota archaeon]